MKRILSSNLLTLLAGAIGLSVSGVPSAAIASTPFVQTCNARVNLTLSILGAPIPLNLPCVNGTRRDAAGESNSSLVGTSTLGLPELANVMSLTAPQSHSLWAVDDDVFTLQGDERASDITVLQNNIVVDDVAGGLRCRKAASDPLMHCAATTTIGSVSIFGQPIELPPEPIPFNTALPIPGTYVPLTILGLPFNLSASGSLTVNQLTDTGPALEHAPFAIALSAAAGPISLTLNVQDYVIFDTLGSPYDMANPTYDTWKLSY